MNPTSADFRPVPEAPGIFIDALIADEVANPVFVSAWGRDTSVQEFLARLSIPETEGGLREFSVGDSHLTIANPDDLEKRTARASSQTVFGELVNLWLYRSSLVNPDFVNGRAALLYVSDNDLEQQVWNLIKEVARIPLLDHWRDVLIDRCYQHGWLRHRGGFKVSMYEIRFDHDAFEAEVKRLLKDSCINADPNTQAKEPPACISADDLISSYSRAQAIEDEVLVDVTVQAREYGYRYPVALTAAAHADCVAWTDHDSDRQTYQDESGRLSDVLYMGSLAARSCAKGASQVFFELLRIPRDGKSTEPKTVQLKSVVGPGDAFEPVITISLPYED